MTSNYDLNSQFSYYKLHPSDLDIKYVEKYAELINEKNSVFNAEIKQTSNSIQLTIKPYAKLMDMAKQSVDASLLRNKALFPSKKGRCCGFNNVLTGLAFYKHIEENYKTRTIDYHILEEHIYSDLNYKLGLIKMRHRTLVTQHGFTIESNRNKEKNHKVAV